jgi:hypothetical protein
MRKLQLIFIPFVLLAYQSAFAADWQTPLMWDWVLGTASPQLTALENENASQQAQIDAVLSQNVALLAQVDALLTLSLNLAGAVETLQANSVLELDGVLVMDTHNGNPVARFQGVNVQVVNGQGSTATINGLGNLIVGYDEIINPAPTVCSQGDYSNEQDCTTNGLIWNFGHKTGSHNLVVGRGHSYSDWGGFVSGEVNVINQRSSSVTGGSWNTASGSGSSVSGGALNEASSDFSSVSGGRNNTASGTNSSVSGGFEHTASGNFSSVSGGRRNTASGQASGVSGGYLNEASGTNSSVSGGLSDTVAGDYDWRAGDLFQDD